MLRKKQIASYIDANFGKSPLDGGMYYDGTGRMKLIREYHEMRECESEVDAITWEDLETDAQIAVASYRKSRTIWCKPEAEHGRIAARGLVHPLLKNAVGNDFILEDRAILTGANASGKSTFMKAVAINMILAQTIHTCTAGMFGVENVCVMTCMSLRDDVESGESYYFREAKYLRRIVEQMKKGRVFCVIDEIFKGTNTTERIAA